MFAPDRDGGAQRTAVWLTGTVLAAHLLANPHYGFFRDELYFIVCGRHLQLGYVDQPPLVPFLAAGSQVFGTSLLAIRSIPAVLAAATALIVCLLVRAMDGGRFAMMLAVTGASLAPVLAAFGTFLSPDSVQAALWPLAILFVAYALDRSPHWWLAAGVTLGVAGEAKYSAVMAGAALLGGLALTPARRAFLSPWFWAGGVAAGFILLPNAIWQWAHGMPMLELLHNGQHGKNTVLSPLGFLLQQIQLTNPPLSLIAVAGIGWCFYAVAWRWLGATVLILLAMMIVLHGKAYYPTPIYPAAFAAGGVAIASLTTMRPRLRGFLGSGALAFGLVLVPLTLPILPEPQAAAYLGFLGRLGIRLSAGENHRQAVLGQLFADMHGWRQLANQVAAIMDRLPPAVRDRTRIFASNYGEAAAIEVLAPPGTRPQVISGHNQYFLWGPRGWDGSSLLDVNGDLQADRALCGSAVVVGTFTAPYVMPYEDDLPIVLCQDLKQSVSSLWPMTKHFE